MLASDPLSNDILRFENEIDNEFRLTERDLSSFDCANKASSYFVTWLLADL
jgi:hypothetical protein